MSISKESLLAAIRAADPQRRGWVLNQVLAGPFSFSDLITDLVPIINAEIERADPLAALESAERRLLERQGWEARPFNMWLRRSAGGVQQTTQENAVQIERRRLAAKGGV